MKWASQAVACNQEKAKELAERLEAVEKFDLAFLTTTLNDDLIKMGRAYSCEQAYPIIAKFGKADLEIAKHPATDETRPAMRDAYIHTRALYEQVFGPIKP